MKHAIQNTIMTDGSKVFDVNLFTNGTDTDGRRKCIFTCNSENAACNFLDGLQKLIDEFTIETFECDM